MWWLSHSLFQFTDHKNVILYNTNILAILYCRIRIYWPFSFHILALDHSLCLGGVFCELKKWLFSTTLPLYRLNQFYCLYLPDFTNSCTPHYQTPFRYNSAWYNITYVCQRCNKIMNVCILRCLYYLLHANFSCVISIRDVFTYS